MNKLFETTVKNIGGRTGRSFSPDGNFSVDIAPARELSGVDTAATNPEQLFAAGYAACFNSALQSVLRRNKVPYEATEVNAVVSLWLEPKEHSYSIAVRIQASIKGMDPETARPWVEKAHTVCPYSKAVHGNIDVTLEVY